MSIIIYQEHCDYLEKENEELRDEILFLKTQLEYKTLGLPEGVRTPLSQRDINTEE